MATLIASKTLSVGITKLAGKLGIAAAEGAGGEAFKLVVNLLGFDDVDAKLDKVLNELRFVREELTKISDTLKDIELNLDVKFAGEHADWINTNFMQYSLSLANMAFYAKTAKNSAQDKEDMVRAKKALVERGQIIANDVVYHCERLDKIIQGETGAKSMIVLAHEAYVKKAKGLVQHYMFIKSFCVKYWAIQLKAILLMTWLTDPLSGVAFNGRDVNGVKGPISLVRDNLKKQDKVLKDTVGETIDYFCSTVLGYPTTDRWMTFETATEKHQKWDGDQHNRMHGRQWFIFYLGYDNLTHLSRQSMLDMGVTPVLMNMADFPPPDGADTTSWSITLNGATKDMEFSADADYKFAIQQYHRSTYGPWLHLGLPKNEWPDDHTDFAWCSHTGQAASQWRFWPTKAPDVLKIQFANDTVPENGSFLTVRHEYATWRETGRGTIKGDILARELKDDNNPDQLFRMSG